MTDHTEIRRICRALLGELQLNPPLDAAVLARSLGELLQHPIHLIAKHDEIVGSFGIVIPSDVGYEIIYQGATSVADQNHIIYHELGHIYLKHLGRRRGRTLFCGFAPPGTDPERPRNLYADTSEWEAETFASVLSEWTNAVAADPFPQEEADPVVDRLNHALGDLRGWQ